MNIQTSKFQISAYVRGDESAEKVAIIMPGFLDTKDYAHVRSHVEFLGDRGYYAIGIDMPGTWGSSGAISDFTITNCLRVVDELLKKFNKPAILVGHSNGGRIALHAAARNDHVSAVVAIMSPLQTLSVNVQSESVKKWRETGLRLSRRDLPNDAEKFQEFTVPLSFLEDSQRYNLVGELPKIAVPKLFVAGKQDVIILPKEVKQAYTLAAKPKRYRIVDSTHDYRRTSATVELVNEIIDQFLSVL